MGREKQREKEERNGGKEGWKKGERESKVRGQAGGGGMEKEGKEVAGDAQERRRKGCGRFSSFSFYLVILENCQFRIYIERWIY